MNLKISQIQKFKPNNPIEVKLLLNSLEDCAYYYMNSDDNNEKQNCLEYFHAVSDYLMEHSKKIDKKIKKENKIFNIIKERKKDLNNIDEKAAESITETAKETVINFANYIKSYEAFYAIQGNYKTENSNFDMFSSIEQKSVKMENIGKYLLYMMSGKASADYKEDPSTKNFKSKCEKALGLKMDTCTPHGFDAIANGLDGNTYIMEATSNQNTSSQRINELLNQSIKKNSNVIHISTGYFLSDYSNDLEYNGRKATLHGQPFFRKLGANEISKQEIENLNLLPFLSMINQVNTKGVTDYDISDFININPFVIGSDSYSTYKTFRDIKEYNEPERTEKFLSYLIDYSSEVVNTLSKLSNFENNKMDDKTKSIMENTSNLLIGIVSKFNKSNLEKNEPKLKQKEQIIDNMELFKDIALRFYDFELNSFIDDIAEEGLKALKYRYNRINQNLNKKSKMKGQNQYNPKIETRPLKRIKKIIESNLKDYKKDERKIILEAIKIKQDKNQQTFDKALKVLPGIGKEKFSNILTYIYNTDDFNKKDDLDIFEEQIVNEFSPNIYRENRNNDYLFDEILLQKKFSKNLNKLINLWEDINQSSYYINRKIISFIGEISEQKTLNYKFTRKMLRDTDGLDATFRNINEGKNESKRAQFNEFILTSMGLVDLYNEPRENKDAFIDIASVNANLENSIYDMELKKEKKIKNQKLKL